jgi:hypothetical protein
MFVRKRERATKNGKTSTTYQLLEAHRETGKVKQRVICSLGRDATPEEALKNVKEHLRIWTTLLERAKQKQYRGIDKEAREKNRERHIKYHEKKVKKLKENLRAIEGVVSER